MAHLLFDKQAGGDRRVWCRSEGRPGLDRGSPPLGTRLGGRTDLVLQNLPSRQTP